MSENVKKPDSVTPPIEDEEEKRRKLEEAEVEEGLDKHLDKMYRAIGELIEATKTLATHLKSASETNRGLIESVKGELVSLREEFKKFSAGFGDAVSAHKKQDKFDEGDAKVSDNAEEVTYKPEDLRERGKEALEKSISDLKKSVSVVAPRMATATREVAESKDVSLVRKILSGETRAGEIVRNLKEVFSA